MMSKNIICLALIILSFTSFAQDNWITSLPKQILVERNFKDINFIEIPVSKKLIAIRTLTDKDYIELNSTRLNYYLGNISIEKKTKHAILVRGNYMNGELGQFVVSQYRDNLWVRFSTFGKESELHRTALIAFVETLPQKVYVTNDTN